MEPNHNQIDEQKHHHQGEC